MATIGVCVFRCGTSVAALFNFKPKSKITKKDDYIFYTYNGEYYFVGYLGKDAHLILPASYNDETYKFHKYAFKCNYDDNYINSITITDGFTTIGDNAFSGCNGLHSIVIPDSVTYIGEEPFIGCANLRNLYYAGSEEEWKVLSVNVNYYGKSDCTFHYNYVPKE